MTEADFLKTILAHPDDEVARLAFADWLMERGDAKSVERGEFIQAQVQLARRTEGAGSPAEWVDAARIPELRAREQVLLGAHGTAWAQGIAPLVDGYQFRRGFVEAVTIDGNRFLASAGQLLATAPIQRLRLTGGLTKRMADCPYLGWITALDLSRTYIGDAGLRTLLASPNLGKLTWLDLSHCYLTNRGVQSLAESPLLRQLDHLNLGFNSLSLPAVQALLGSPHWGKARSLVLAGNYGIDARAQEFLAQTLQGAPDVSLLGSMLHLAAREAPEHDTREVRALAERAGRDPERAPAVLAEALGDGHRKVRAAAARMLAQLGSAAESAVPKLVQRLFEQSAQTRDHVAPALARLLPQLDPRLQRWLCKLANPLLSPLSNLWGALEHPELPAEVREGFAGLCARRAAWWAHLGSKAPGPAPAPGSYGTDLPTVLATVSELMVRAERHAGRHLQGDAQRREGVAARHKEAAWLLGRLTALIQASLRRLIAQHWPDAAP
jgi:uncharacterized protein (TIGR02996 family)